MADPKIEESLRDFLAWVETQRRAGADVGALVGVVQALRGEVAQMRGEVATVKRIALYVAKDRLVDRDRGERHGRRLESLEHAVALVTRAPAMNDVPNYNFDPEERTGRHHIEAIRQQVAELEEDIEEEEERKRNSVLWWRRQRVVWFAAAIGFVLATAISTGCSVAVARLMPPPAASSQSK